QAGGAVKVLKQADSYRITGDNRANFGILPVDTLFGVAGSGLAVSVGQDLYYWSLEGPRVSRGGESTDLALPLELDGEEPADLVEAGGLHDGFAAYEPERRIVHFVFGRRGYALHLKDPSNPRWSYNPFGVEL